MGKKSTVIRIYDDRGNLLQKQCSKCGQVKNVSEFYRCIGYFDGLKNSCKGCAKSGVEKWRENNQEYRKEYNKKHYENNKEAILKQQKEYAQTPEGKAAKARTNHKRRLKVRDNGGTWTLEEWNSCLAYFDYKDAYTGEPLTTTEMEHVIPVSKGGTTYIYNIVPANGPTNRSKGKKDLFEWYSQQPYFSWERYLKICMWVIKNGGASKDINIKE